jgi:K(+)-stimulated pyrophosphate-energized sodium pump
MLIDAVGIFLSIIGIFIVKTKEGASMKKLLRSLSIGTNVSAFFIIGASFLILYLLGIQNWIGLSCSVVVGLLVGIVIGQSTEYYTSQSYNPTKKIAYSGQTGPATVIIAGLGTGMLSVAIPVIAGVCGVIFAFLFASGFTMGSFDFTNLSSGLYGIGIAAVGMLSTLGITLHRAYVLSPIMRAECRNERTGTRST